MSISHLNELRSQLERRHWVVERENRTLSPDSCLHWRISRPNGDSRITLEFTPGHGGTHGDIQLDAIEDSIACDVVEHPEIDYLYFGSKFQGKFQQDVVEFADAINQIDK